MTLPIFFLQFAFWTNISCFELCWVDNHPDVWSEGELSFFLGDICQKFWPHEYNARRGQTAVWKVWSRIGELQQTNYQLVSGRNKLASLEATLV